MQSMKLRDGDKDGATSLTQVDSSGRDRTMAKQLTARPVTHAAVETQNLVKVGK